MLYTLLASLLVAVGYSTAATDPSSTDRCNFVVVDTEIAAADMCHYGSTAGEDWGLVVECGATNEDEIMFKWYDNIDCAGDSTNMHPFLNATDHECENEYCNQLRVTRYLESDMEDDECGFMASADYMTTGCVYETCAYVSADAVGSLECDGVEAVTTQFWVGGTMCTGDTSTEYTWYDGCAFYNNSGEASYLQYDVECCNHEYQEAGSTNIPCGDYPWTTSSGEPEPPTEEPDTTEGSKDPASIVTCVFAFLISAAAAVLF